MKLTKPLLIATTLGAAALTLTIPAAQSQAPAPPAAGAPAQPGAPGGGRGGFGRGAATPFDYADNEGWQSLFDGQTMNGWDGDTRFWSIKDGAIYVNPTCEKPTGTIYAIWKNGAPADFALKYELKGTTGINGGMQFRSYLTADSNVEFRYPPRAGRGGGRGPGGPGAPGGRGAAAGGPGGPGGPGGRGPGRGPACANPGTPPPASEEAKWDLYGPQADFDGNNNFSGMFYEQGGRGIISMPGHAILAEAGKPVKDLGTIADKATLDSWFKKEDYNQFLIVAKGNTTSIYMNGHLTTLFIDNDPVYFRAGGKIGLEVEATGEQWARNIFLKRL